MGTKKFKKTRLMSYGEWIGDTNDTLWNILYPEYSCDYVLTSFINSGKNWNTPEESYELYKDWYYKTYTKLGRILA